MKILFKTGKELHLESPEEIEYVDGIITIIHDTYILHFNTKDILYAENSEGYKFNWRPHIEPKIY